MTLYSKIEGKGQPLIILHGFLGMSDNWKTLGTQYAAAGFEVHMLDLRNHGRSFHSDEFTYDDMVQDVLQYCNEKNLEQVSIIGHSMGGKVAMLFAVSHPNKVEKLIVADITPRHYPPHHQDILAGLNAVDFTKKPSRDDVDEILKPFIPELGTRQFLMKSLYWLEPGQLAFRFNLKVFTDEIEEVGDALETSALFDKPTLFLKGAMSNYITDDDANIIRKHFPNARIVAIANAGHWLHAENPEDFFSETLAFLK